LTSESGRKRGNFMKRTTLRISVSTRRSVTFSSDGRCCPRCGRIVQELSQGGTDSLIAALAEAALGNPDGSRQAGNHICSGYERRS
jgi:hypothetical protein